MNGDRARAIVSVYVDEIFVVASSIDRLKLQTTLSKFFPVQPLGVLPWCMGRSCELDTVKGPLKLTHKICRKFSC